MFAVPIEELLAYAQHAHAQEITEDSINAIRALELCRNGTYFALDLIEPHPAPRFATPIAALVFPEECQPVLALRTLVNVARTACYPLAVRRADHADEDRQICVYEHVNTMVALPRTANGWSVVETTPGGTVRRTDYADAAEAKDAFSLAIAGRRWKRHLANRTLEINVTDPNYTGPSYIYTAIEPEPKETV